jgi:hypothetical protein
VTRFLNYTDMKASIDTAIRPNFQDQRGAFDTQFAGRPSSPLLTMTLTPLGSG